MNIIANHKSSKFIFDSDSKSVLQSLQNKNASTSLNTKLLDKINIYSKNNSIILTWTPSHIGKYGNERADKAAKIASLADIPKTKVPLTNLKPTIKKFILDKWQKSWDDQIPHKLHRKQDTIGELPAGYRYWPHPHYPLTPPKIGKLPSVLTIKHILINGDRFNENRPKYLQINNVNDLFKYIKTRDHFFEDWHFITK